MTNYFVDGVHGDDAYTGDSGTPWHTLGKAQRALILYAERRGELPKLVSTMNSVRPKRPRR